MRTKIEYWCPRKTIQGQKYIKLADIATLTQLDGILTSPLTSEVVQNRQLVVQYPWWICT